MPSAKILEIKKAEVTKWAEALKSAQTVVVADYRGLTVAEDTELRKAMRENGVEYHVIKNTMATLAAREAGLEGLEDLFKGPTAIAFSSEDPVSPAKIAKDFAKKFKPFEIKGGATEGKAVDLSVIEQLAAIPSRETLLTQLVFTLNSPIVGLARALDEISKLGGEAPAEAAEAEAAPVAEEVKTEETTEASAE